MASEAPNQDHPPELTMKYSERCYCGDNLLCQNCLHMEGMK